MPLRIENTAGGKSWSNPFVGEMGPPAHLKLDVSTLTTDEVDSRGYLKPGVPLKVNGALVSGAGQVVYGMTCEAQKIVADNPTNTTLGEDTSDPLVTVIISGLVNLDVVEDNLGRALSANELAAIAAAGCHLLLTTT